MKYRNLLGRNFTSLPVFLSENLVTGDASTEVNGTFWATLSPQYCTQYFSINGLLESLTWDTIKLSQFEDLDKTYLAQLTHLHVKLIPSVCMELWERIFRHIYLKRQLGIRIFSLRSPTLSNLARTHIEISRRWNSQFVEYKSDRYWLRTIGIISTYCIASVGSIGITLIFHQRI